MIQFKTSSFCSLGDCVEVGRDEDGDFVVRRSPTGATGGQVWFAPHEWAAFVAGVKNGEFDVEVEDV